MAKHTPMFKVATLDITAYDGPNSKCVNCDEEKEDLLYFEVSGSEGYNSEFVICAECMAESLDTVSNGEGDSINVSVRA
jgi:hypothetical protein